MDINQSLQSIVNREVAKQDWTPSVSGNQSLSTAVKEDKIALTPTVKLEETLKFIMLLVDIRAQNLPTPPEKKILIDFIQNHYGGHTCEEIVLAFEMAVTDKLSFKEKEDANHYGSFSCAYFSKIMNAYRKWAVSEIQFIQKEEPPKLPAPPTNWASVWEDYQSRSKYQDIEKMIIIIPVCDWLIEQGVLLMTEEEEKAIIQMAKNNYLIELQETPTGQNREIASRLTKPGWNQYPDIMLSIQNRAKIMGAKKLLRDGLQKQVEIVNTQEEEK